VCQSVSHQTEGAAPVAVWTVNKYLTTDVRNMQIRQLGKHPIGCKHLTPPSSCRVAYCGRKKANATTQCIRRALGSWMRELLPCCTMLPMATLPAAAAAAESESHGGLVMWSKLCAGRVLAGGRHWWPWWSSSACVACSCGSPASLLCCHALRGQPLQSNCQPSP
jgi:hypothetical protein